MSPSTHESQAQGNQSAFLSNQENRTVDTSFPTATVIIPVLGLVVISALLLLGFMFRKKIKTWICRRFDKSSDDAELANMRGQTPPKICIREKDPDMSSTDPTSSNSQANTSFSPLLAQGNGDV